MKNKIGNILLLVAGVVLIGLLFYLYKESENKKNGERLTKRTKHLSIIDSLRAEQVKSDTIIKEIVRTKTKIKTEYVQDTIYINSLPFDSLKLLFLSEYPRHNSNQQVSDSIYSKR